MNTAWKHIRRTPYQALAAIFIMTLTFFVGTLIAVIAHASTSLLHYYETRPQIIAYLKNSANSEQVNSLKENLQNDSRIENVKYVSKEKALEIYKEATASNPKLSEFVSPKVFPASFEFSIKGLNFTKEIISQLQTQEIIEEVAFTANLGDAKNLNQVVERLNRISNYVKIGGGSVVGFLLISSLLVLLVIISMRISARREEIEILQLLGATPGFIQTPFVLEGMFYSLVGGALGWLLALLLTLYMSPSIVSFFQPVPFLPSSLPQLLKLFGVVLGGELVLCLLLGTTGSFIAIKRYLKI